MTRAIRQSLLTITCALFSGGIAAAERLPLVAVPEHYVLEFTPDLASETFAGEATIHIRVLQPTTEIVLHAAELDLQRVQVESHGRLQDASVTLDAAHETAALRLPQALDVGTAALRIRYRGTLNRQLRGFYISEANGRKYAVTQLEATDARRMFPSFDEPQYKSTFAVSATVDRHDYAISNGAVSAIESGPSPDKRTFRFATTAPMSSYLVALAIGDFECTEGEAAGTPLRVCATPGQQRLTSYALDATEDLLGFMNEYFAIDYPFAKLDQIAIPDFAAGAMENTGAIFYRESILLVDPDTASLAARKRAALVIAHEIAHHWFGNLVTMQWWDDLWLNEGFATWMEMKAVAAWKPEWHVRLDEVQSIHNAMALDALQTTRPVRMDAETPEEINELFDPIAYEKGAAILGMVEAYVGEQAFRGGVNGYLEEYQYDNATAQEFWALVTRTTGKPVDRVMATFVTQPGVPLVTVTTACRDGRMHIEMTQQRYDLASSVDTAAGTWVIPVCLRLPPGNKGSADDPTHCELLLQPTTRRTLDRCPSWLVANAGAEGYYRTVYTPPMVNALTERGTLTPAEAIALVSDEWALVRAGRVDAGRFLSVAGALASQPETAEVVESIGSRLAFAHEYLTSGASRERLEQWVRARLRPALRQLEPASAEASARMRAALMLALGTAGHDDAVLREAKQAVTAYLAGGSTAVHPNVLNAIVALAPVAGDRALYEAYLARSRRAENPEEHYRFLYGLAAFRDPELIRRTIDLAFSNEVRAQDRGRLIGAILDNPAAREVAWSRVKDEWSELQRTLGAFGGASSIIEGLGAFCSSARAADIQAFFAVHPAPAGERTLQQTLERIENCAATAAAQRHELTKWLATAAAGAGR